MSQSGQASITATAVGRTMIANPSAAGCSIQAVSSGTINYDVEWSNDGENWIDHTSISGATSSANGAFSFPTTYVAVNVNSVSGGTVTVTFKGQVNR